MWLHMEGGGATRQGRVGQSDSGLDHLWTNVPGQMFQIHTHYNGSDHKVIMGTRYSKIQRSSTRYVKKRSYKKFDELKFLEEVKKTSWWDVYSSTDVNEAVQLFSSKFNKMAPVKVFQTSSKYCPWLSDETKELIKERNKAQKILSENKTKEHFEQFKRLRNQATKFVRCDKYNRNLQK